MTDTSKTPMQSHNDQEMAFLIQADIDGELSPADAARVAAHIEASESGAALHAELLAVSGRIRREASRFTPPTGFEDRVRARLGRQRLLYPRERSIASRAFVCRARFWPSALRSAPAFAIAAMLLLTLMPPGPRRGSARQRRRGPRARAPARAPAGRDVERSSHRAAVVRRPAGLRAAGEGVEGDRLPATRRTARLSRRSSRRRPRLRRRSASHRSVCLAGQYAIRRIERSRNPATTMCAGSRTACSSGRCPTSRRTSSRPSSATGGRGELLAVGNKNTQCRVIYPAHARIRKSLGEMTRKLSVTSSQ